MRAVRASDHDWLYHLCVIVHGGRWKFRGATPSPADFAAQLWVGVHAQFVVTTADGRPVGLVGLYNTNLVAAHTHLFAIAEPGSGPVVTDACVELVSWAFDEFELAKVWIESAEFNLEQFPGVLRHATVEARLSNHEYHRGRYWDLVICSMTAASWDAQLRRSRTGDVVAPAAASGVSIEWLEALVAELWPIDSLGAVELVDHLEEATGTWVDLGALEGCDRTGPAAFASSLLEAIGRADGGVASGGRAVGGELEESAAAP
jgi:RimJ/RimL family protein N-acetyltransferase